MDVLPRLAPPAATAVDLASQGVLSAAEHSAARFDPRFPIGRGKLEALAVIGCACLMSVASLEVVQLSALDLYNGWARGARCRCHRCRVLGLGGWTERLTAAAAAALRVHRAALPAAAGTSLQASCRRWSWGPPCSPSSSWAAS